MALPEDPSGSGSGEPGIDWYAITPNDNGDLPQMVRAIYVGVTGDLTLVSSRGRTATFIAVAVGYHPLRPVRVKSTGTTATGLVGIF